MYIINAFTGIPEFVEDQATTTTQGLQSAQGKRIEQQNYEDCAGQVANSATFNPASFVAADVGLTAVAAGTRLFCQTAGGSCVAGIYVATSATAATLSNTGADSVRQGAKIKVTGLSSGPVEYWQTAATGSGTAVFAVEPINLDGTTNETINASGHAIIDFNNKMGANVSCTTTTPTQLMTSIFGVESAAGEMTASHTYVCTIGIRITLWETATPTVAGNIDLVIDAVVVTDGSNLPTVTFNTTPAPDASRLPSALSTAVATCTALAAGLGYSVSLTQSSGVTCTAIARTWINRMVEVA